MTNSDLWTMLRIVLLVAIVIGLIWSLETRRRERRKAQRQFDDFMRGLDLHRQEAAIRLASWQGPAAKGLRTRR